MRDESYAADQLPSYGAIGQPAAVARMGRHLRTVRIGQVVAMASLVTATLALVFYGDGWEGTGGGWFVALLVCAAVLNAACVFQLVAWLQASASWGGQGRVNAHQLRTASFAAMVVAYVITALAVVIGVIAVLEASWQATASLLVLATLILMCVALVTAGVQRIHRSGPPRAAPRLMRGAVERQNRR